MSDSRTSWLFGYSFVIMHTISILYASTIFNWLVKHASGYRPIIENPYLPFPTLESSSSILSNSSPKDPIRAAKPQPPLNKALIYNHPIFTLNYPQDANHAVLIYPMYGTTCHGTRLADITGLPFAYDAVYEWEQNWMSARRDYGLFGRSSSPPPSSMKGTVISPEKGTEYGKNWTLITLSTLAESARNDTRAWNRTEPQAPKEPEFKGEGQTSPCILIDNALGGSGAGALYLWRSPWVLEGAPGFEVREGRPTAAAMWFGRGCEGVPDQVGSLPVLEMDVCLRAAGGFEVRNRVLWEKGGGGEAGGGKESMWKPVWWSDFIRRKKEPDRSRQGWRSVRIWYGSSRVTEDRFWGEGTISLREEFVKMKGRIGIEVGEEEGWVGDEW